jgi:hypothetical protein
MLNSLPASRIHGSVDCATNTAPAFQVQALDSRTIRPRQKTCTNFEAPFLYLLIGSEKVLLLNSGAEPHPGQAFDTGGPSVIPMTPHRRCGRQ